MMELSKQGIPIHLSQPVADKDIRKTILRRDCNFYSDCNGDKLSEALIQCEHWCGPELCRILNAAAALANLTHD